MPALLPDTPPGLVGVSLPFCLAHRRGWAGRLWTGILLRTQPSPETPVLDCVCIEHQTGLKTSGLGWIFPWSRSVSLLRSWLPVLSPQSAPTAESQQAWQLWACLPLVGTHTVTAIRIQRSLAGAKVRGGSGGTPSWETSGFSSSESIWLPLRISQVGPLSKRKEN